MKLRKKIDEDDSLTTSTKKGYFDAILIVERHCPFLDEYVKNVTASMLNSFLNETLKRCKTSRNSKVGYAKKTRKHVLLMLKKVFELYLESRDLKSSPFNEGKIKVKGANDQKYVHPYSRDELLKLSARATDDFVVQSFILASEEGLRTGEIFGATVSGFDPEEQTLKIKYSIVGGELKQPKTEKSIRVISLTELSTKILKQQLLQGKTCKMTFMTRDGEVTEDFFFVAPTTQQPWKSSVQYYHALSKYFELANVEFRGSKVARHTFVNNSINAGMRKVDVADHCGQTSVKVMESNYLLWQNNIRGGLAFKEQRNTSSLNISF
ncbi:tyrosine-type recombinase/integrase [Vibrio ishigakensis]|uniref:tyrosine-type recombinase/integrase n=1 Tax=Vibrio ishigakensis TaxID=1481914 RepID=UPI0021C285D6|nr:tyrosine-type recombinase/integrase [Vibrio ishigakensis]